ncbi:MAG TPA: LamG domain-containing protein, partial [Polyangiaceae bacterium]|nr:LamG domain-containing protein [Polyangiaceae bacterium]
QTAIDQANQGVYACFTAPPNTWIHVAGSWDGSTARVYLDGALQNESTARTGNGTAVTNTAIGMAEGAYGYFNGILDEIAIFDRALAEPEILAIYEVGASGMCGR